MNRINIKQSIAKTLILVFVLSFSFTAYAKGEFISVSTVHSNSPDKAYGHRLGNDVWGIWNSIEENMEADKSTKHKNFDKALIRADKVIEKFKGVFDKNKTQYVFENDSHYEKFIKINDSDFQRIDNSYKEALQIKAYIYSDLKEYGRALEYLEEVQSVAPTSAKGFIEQGYIFSQYKLNDLATSAYVKAEFLARKYPEGQLSERASALRGMGFILIEEGKLDGVADRRIACCNCNH
jgi:tetratricopeptide (TPR) repeat protein